VQNIRAPELPATSIQAQEPMTELFETFDEAGRPTGLAPRDRVHATGLWHRSAHVFLFDPDGALYIQQRAAGKDLFPGRWDFSVGEHLQPGESYLAAALRGLREELGVSGVTLTPLGAVRVYRCDIASAGIADHELQQAFQGCCNGPLTPDASEVAAVRSIVLPDLLAWTAREPDAFTPWFIKELNEQPGLATLATGRPGRAPGQN